MDNNLSVKKRNIAVCIVLTVITAGIYGLYWWCKINSEIKQLSGDNSGPGGVAVILLSLITCNIYDLYWMYKQGGKIDSAKIANGKPSGNSGVVYLILSLIGLSIVSFALMQNEINNIVGE